jgi:predicted metal-dependent hydrolase
MTAHAKAEGSLMPEDVTVTVRKFQADDYGNARKYWFANNAVMSMAASVFSIYIPRGEKFFIKSVRYFEDRIEDPELKEKVKDFIKQEANHYRAHEDFNASLETKGINVQKELDTAERMFSLMEKWLPKKTQLGITVFAEHLTATGAKQMLKNPQVAEHQDPEVRKLWEWHAAEEIEHKSVAYDVYEAMGCGYFHRMWSVLIGLVFQFGFLYGSMKRVLKKEGETVSIKQQAGEARRLMKEFHPDRKELLEEFKMYFKPGFHPWQIDDRPFLKTWYQKQNNQA